MTNNDKMIRANFAFILFILIAVCVNLNSRVRVLETSNSDLQQTIQTQKDELEKIEEKNTMQDVIINKLNNDYNSRIIGRKKMDLKKEFFQEADKVIAEFGSIYDFF